jgi:hypothetical protein
MFVIVNKNDVLQENIKKIIFIKKIRVNTDLSTFYS